MHSCCFYCKFQVDENLRFMILMDGIHPEMDTCIIVEYKGTFLPSPIMKEKNAPGRKGDNSRLKFHPLFIFFHLHFPWNIIYSILRKMGYHSFQRTY